MWEFLCQISHLRRITKNRKGAVEMNQGEDGDQSSDGDEDGADGPSTSTAKKIKK